MKKRISITLDDDIARVLRDVSRRSGESISSLINALIRPRLGLNPLPAMPKQMTREQYERAAQGRTPDDPFWLIPHPDETA